MLETKAIIYLNEASSAWPKFGAAASGGRCKNHGKNS